MANLLNDRSSLRESGETGIRSWAGRLAPCRLSNSDGDDARQSQHPRSVGLHRNRLQHPEMSRVNGRLHRCNPITTDNRYRRNHSSVQTDPKNQYFRHRQQNRSWFTDLYRGYGERRAPKKERKGVYSAKSARASIASYTLPLLQMKKTGRWQCKSGQIIIRRISVDVSSPPNQQIGTSWFG